MSFRKEKIKDYFLLDTHVENIFINEYMAMAPGDFVKVYLFAQMYADLGIEISNEDIARNLSLDEEDVLKAWTYWEKMGAVRKIKKDPENKYSYDVEFTVLKEKLYGETESLKRQTIEQNTQTVMADKEVQDMFAAIEKITGRVISGTEMMEILSWINDFNASAEVIVYCYSYCVQKKKKKNIKYIAAVIRQWTSEGLKDVIAVEKYLSELEKKQHLYRRIFQALGFSRNATEEEKRIMDTWFDTMGFSLEKVLSACSKTSGISNPNINYVNKVLTNMYEERDSKTAGGRQKDVSVSQVMEYYDILRSREEKEAISRRREVFEKVPRIKEIEDELAAASAELSRIIISDTVDRKEAVAERKEKIDSLNMEKAFLLTDNGFELNYMDMAYKCPKCKDTGILETGERCQCFGEVTTEKIRLMKNGTAE